MTIRFPFYFFLNTKYITVILNVDGGSRITIKPYPLRSKTRKYDKQCESVMQMYASKYVKIRRSLIQSECTFIHQNT